MIAYKELYLKMVRASEQAITTLIAAQQECEALYIDAKETETIPFPVGSNEAEENKSTLPKEGDKDTL